METQSTNIPDVMLFFPKIHGDSRGYFMESWKDTMLSETLVQENQSMSANRGTIRGLHYQRGAASQGKLLRVLSGSLIDVAVDLRRGSPHFGRHVVASLSSSNGGQIWVPPGFAHGFCTLEDNTTVLYKATAYYNPSEERGVNPFDLDLGISWPGNSSSKERFTIADRDASWPFLRDIPEEDLF